MRRAFSITKCIICKRRLANNQDKYCANHMHAHDNLKKIYEILEKAFAGMSWMEYLRRLLELNKFGSW